MPLCLYRASTNSTTGSSPFEFRTGRKFESAATVGLRGTPLDPSEIDHASFYGTLTVLIASLSEQVQQRPKTTTSKDERPSEWVWLKVVKRKWSEPRWTGPFQVVEVTTHSVKLKGKGDAWFHLTQCAPADPPQRTLSETETDLAEM